MNVNGHEHCPAAMMTMFPNLRRRRRSAARRRMSAGPAAPAPNEEEMAGPGTGGVQGPGVSSAAANASMERPSASSHSSSAMGVKEQAVSDASAAPPSARSTKPPAPSSSRVKEKVEEESPPRRGGNNISKVMANTIRCYANAAAATSSSTNTSEPATRKRKADGRASAFWFGMGPVSSAGSDLAASLDTIPVASAQLLGVLRTIGATAPARAYGKMLPRSDRRRQQSRLLMSAKAWRTDAFPLDTFLSAAEWAAARDQNGLEVLALDRDGEPYPGMTLKFLECNTGYRVIGKWGSFLERNGLVLPPRGPRVSDAMLDLWVFRARGGDLGLVFMHYRKGDSAHADAAFEEAAARPRKARCNKRRLASSAAEQEDSVDEDVIGDDVDEELIPDLNDDVVMEDAADYDAARHEEEAAGGEAAAALPPSSDAIIGATAAATEEETTGSKEEEAAAVTVALNVNGAVKLDDAGGAQGKATSPSLSSSNASGVAEVAKASALVSTAAGVDEEGAAARGRAAELASLLSSCKPDVIQAAETLMLMYQSSR